VEEKPLKSGELAKLAGISTDTLRHYEKMGVLAEPLRSGGNYRLYPRQAVDRVKLVRGALAIGFSLAELKKILRVREQGGAPCRQVKALLEDKLAQTDREIESLKALRAHLRALLEDWHARLATTPEGQPARLLENLPALKGPNDNPARNRFARRTANGKPRRSRDGLLA
jgi:DNA-binding transcriptional MerR regulator